MCVCVSVPHDIRVAVFAVSQVYPATPLKTHDYNHQSDGMVGTRNGQLMWPKLSFDKV